jgi:thiol-disulfide isomerase/thioredoxin
MTSTRRRCLAALACAAFAAPLPALSQRALRRDWPKGRPTPALALPAFEAAPWDLASDARGQVAVLNFWASWCEPCRTEMPSLELLAQRYEADGLVVVAVNHRETDAAIRRFMDLMPITLPILRDADGAAARDWGVRVFPTTIIVGRDGRAAFAVIGGADWNAEPVRRWFEPLLGRRS